MKSARTKAQEVVDVLWGPGQYLVSEQDVDKVASHVASVLTQMFAPEYVEALVKDIRNGGLSSVERQRKFHLMQNLPVASECITNSLPDLEKVDYSEDRQWSLGDLAEALFGQAGDMKIYNVDLPTPENKEFYTTEEVRRIVSDRG